MRRRTYYLICAGVILAIALFLAGEGGIFSADTPSEIFRILSDSFFVPGILFMGCGALGWMATKGTYDMLSFGCGRITRNFIPGMDKEKFDNFYQYKQRRDEDGRKWKPHLLISGAMAFLLALVFTVLYFITK